MRNESKAEMREAPRRPNESHLDQPFDHGRLDNEVEAPKLLIDVIHVGVAVWGLLLAAGVYAFGGEDWRKSLLVIGVFAFFLVAWRFAMFVGARRKARKGVSEKTSTDPSRMKNARRPAPTESSDPHGETSVADASLDATAEASEFAER